MTVMRSKLAIAALMTASLALGLARTARAQDEAAALSDDEFVTVAAQSGLAEVITGEIALKRTTTPAVIAFAKQMIADHTKANRDLMVLAERKGITVPTQTDQEHKTVATRLESLEGPAFDREYLRGQVKDHREAVALFMSESRQGQDADLKAFATKTLPILQHHLRMVNQAAGVDVEEEGAGAATPKR